MCLLALDWFAGPAQCPQAAGREPGQHALPLLASGTYLYAWRQSPPARLNNVFIAQVC